MTTTEETGKRILKVIDKHDNELYQKIEKNTNYPDNDKFDSIGKFNNAVDKAEIETLIDMLRVIK